MKTENVEREYLKVVRLDLDLCVAHTNYSIECLGFMRKYDPYLYVKMIDNFSKSAEKPSKDKLPSWRYIKVKIWNTRKLAYKASIFTRYIEVYKFKSLDSPNTIFEDSRITPVENAFDIERIDYINRHFSTYNYGSIIKYAPKRRVILKINIGGLKELMCYGYSTSKYLYVRLHPMYNKYCHSDYSSFYLRVLRNNTEKAETILPGYEFRQIYVYDFIDERLELIDPISTSDIDSIIDILFHEEYEYVGSHLGFGEWKKKETDNVTTQR